MPSANALYRGREKLTAVQLIAWLRVRGWPKVTRQAVSAWKRYEAPGVGPCPFTPATEPGGPDLFNPYHVGRWLETRRQTRRQGRPRFVSRHRHGDGVRKGATFRDAVAGSVAERKRYFAREALRPSYHVANLMRWGVPRADAEAMEERLKPSHLGTIRD